MWGLPSTTGALALVFFIMAVVIALMAIHIRDADNTCGDSQRYDQQVAQQVARLLIQSSSHTHPLLSLEDAVSARLLLTDLSNRHGGLFKAERSLGMEPGKLEVMVKKVEEQLSNVRNHINRIIVEKDKRFNTLEAVEAGLLRSQLPDDGPSEPSESSNMTV